MNDVKTARADEFARAAHASIGQKRKYTGVDYIHHPREVTRILESAGEKDADVLSASLLHDVIEDVTPINPEYGLPQIHELFGENVKNMVIELTDVYTKENYPALNREERKKLEAERISQISDGALKIKFADLLNNTADIMQQDRGFGMVYMKEKQRILSSLRPRLMDTKDPIVLHLYHRIQAQIAYYSSDQ